MLLYRTGWCNADAVKASRYRERSIIVHRRDNNARQNTKQTELVCWNFDYWQSDQYLPLSVCLAYTGHVLYEAFHALARLCIGAVGLSVCLLISNYRKTKVFRVINDTNKKYTHACRRWLMMTLKDRSWLYTKLYSPYRNRQLHKRNNKKKT